MPGTPLRVDKRRERGEVAAGEGGEGGERLTEACVIGAEGDLRFDERDGVRPGAQSERVFGGAKRDLR